VALLPAGLLLTAPAAPLRPLIAATGERTVARAAVAATTAFIVLVAVRSSIQAAYMAFLPKLFADRGWNPAAYGALAGTFMLTAAIGNVITGELADRQGMRAATVWPLLLGVPAGIICLWAPTPATAFVGCALAGLLIGGQHSVLVVHAQRLLPARQGFAAGLILGFTFAAGGIGVWLGGLAADQVGLLPVMQVITLLGVPAALLALTLPGRTGVVQVTESSQPMTP
jgi:FSR family fosmidomycin resistance protein-like MFS transporter